MTESSSQNTGASIQFQEDASYASRIVGTTKHTPVRVESFALKIGHLCVDGEAYLEGGLTLNPYNIHKIREIPAGTEQLLDDGVTKLLISNVFNDKSSCLCLWFCLHVVLIIKIYLQLTTSVCSKNNVHVCSHGAEGMCHQLI